MSVDVRLQVQGEDGERPAAAFLARVGERVRAARERKGFTRKRVSELSQVSQRYLAQIEAGDGNISIGLLYRVADALQAPIERFIGEAEASEADEMRERWRAASPEQRRRALEILSAPAQGRARRVCLIGLRGAGKTTLGRELGQALEAPFVELNREIETLSGMAVEEVIALYGQEGYRRLERQALERVIAGAARLVLAAAGGVVSAPETYELLLDRFHTVWLKAAPEEHMARVRAQGDERPMAGNPKAMEELNAILKAREALYARADETVDTSGRTLGESSADLLQAVRRLGIA
jgi:XRE family aerobic/anaerobic benzoate catabolism transcriptional regulator